VFIRGVSRWTRLALLFLLSLVPGWCRAGETASDLFQPTYDRPWQITDYTSDAGLAQARVFDVAFETNGTVWLASSDGLRRFDGYTWQRFDTNSGLPSSFTRAVLVTRAGELWVGSDAGAGVFDPVRKHYDPRGSAQGLASSNVRQIVEDREGGLWFSCDQWPDPSDRQGGLTVFKDGQWQTFRSGDGLPVDYVIGYFQASDGRQFALTPQGWAQWNGARWAPPVNPGYALDNRVLHMAEGRDGTLFAQGDGQLLMLDSLGEWRGHGLISTLVASTRDGEVVSASRDAVRGTLQFNLWNGRGFVRASAPHSIQPGARLYRLAEAPDGSIWCVGYDTVVRWSYRADGIKCYPCLPPPRRMDARGRVWFVSESNAAVFANGGFKPVPDLGRLQATDESGAVYGRLGSDGRPAVTDPDAPEKCVPVECGLRSAAFALPDAAGNMWFVGTDTNGGVALARCDGNRWQHFAPPELSQCRVRSAVADPERGFWLLVETPGSVDYGMAHFADGRVEWEPFTPARPPLMYPILHVAAGKRWINGYFGLYHSALRLGAPWQREVLPDSGLEDIQLVGPEVLVRFAGGPTGRSGVALFADAHWQVKYGRFYQASVSSDQKTIYLASHGGIYVRRERGTTDLEFMPLPADLLVGEVVGDADGSLWANTSDGVLHCAPSVRPPKTTLDTALTEIPAGGTWPVRFGALVPFAVQTPPEAFQYSWRIDDGQWAPFAPCPEKAINLKQTPPGRHQLSVRARDWAGNIDPEPLVREFTVLPMPLQARAWFTPLVVLVILIIAWLGWLGVSRTREIARSNATLRAEVDTRRRAEAELEQAREKLEHRVAERTAELSLANVSLSREIAERRVAEENRRMLEEQLRQAQKLEAIGTLAGGIAHDFNNILAVIIPNTHLAMDDLRSHPTHAKECLSQVLTASERARSLVSQILAFSRRQKQQRHVIDLAPVVAEALQLLRSAMPATLELVTDLAADTPHVLADPTQIHQVVMNLCTNAEHAMTGGRGRLEVSLSRVIMDEAGCRARPGLKPGIYARLTVRDNGKGISPEIQPRIFEPFFTTKGPGKGTGLGLAVVHGIIKDHEGVVLLHSEPGCGAEFEILLPGRAATSPVAALPAGPQSPGVGGHILIVDDEPSVGEVLGKVLGRHGHRVTVCQQPLAALRTLRESSDRFDLVITDLSMPEMNGLDLCKAMLAIQPKLPVIICTGFGSIITPEQIVRSGVVDVIHKPFNPDVILKVIAETLAHTKG
jgi:signal transduction histidine kinase